MKMSLATLVPRTLFQVFRASDQTEATNGGTVSDQSARHLGKAHRYFGGLEAGNRLSDFKTAY